MNQALWALVIVIAFLLGYIIFLHKSRDKELKTIISGMLSQNPYEFSTAVGSRPPNPLKKAVEQMRADGGYSEPANKMQKVI